MLRRFVTNCIHAALKRYDEENPRRILKRNEVVISFRAEGLDQLEERIDRLAWRAKQLRQEVEELEERRAAGSALENG